MIFLFYSAQYVEVEHDIFCNGGKKTETILSSLQAYFMIAHSSGDFILFYDLKSPDECAIMKQASRDESIVSLFFSPFATYIFIFIKCKILTFAK